MSLISW